jgi:hypothetical protein
VPVGVLSDPIELFAVVVVRQSSVLVVLVRGPSKSLASAADR